MIPGGLEPFGSVDVWFSKDLEANELPWQNVACGGGNHNFSGTPYGGMDTLGVMAMTTAAMYRVGSGNARLDRVRCQDVYMCAEPSETEICVRAHSATNTPGISCWTTQQAATNVASRGRAWELPAGAIYDDTKLRLWQPRPDKWYWSPAQNMRGSEFVIALRAVNAQFR
jgi:hypothetical protein